jgi:hypothetical protein
VIWQIIHTTSQKLHNLNYYMEGIRYGYKFILLMLNWNEKKYTFVYFSNCCSSSIP